MNQSEFESLMMAHDNLQRELSDIKRLIGKDKHELIKSNISLNKKVQELEDVNSQLGYLIGKVYGQSEFEIKDLIEQNKRYREALEFYAGGKHVAYKLDETDDDLVVDYGEIARKALEESE